VGWNEELRSLESKLLTARTFFAELRMVNGRTVVFPFAEWLEQEKHRAGRYNHYFSLLVLASLKLGAPAIVRRVSSSLRTSDILGLVDGNGTRRLVHRLRGIRAAEQHHMVGIILPQTDRAGAQIAARRLRNVLAADDAVTIGLAVFPDDSTNPAELLNIAKVDRK